MMEVQINLVNIRYIQTVQFKLEKHGINKALISHVFLGKNKHFNDIY
jgi:hypothetical protein